MNRTVRGIAAIIAVTMVAGGWATVHGATDVVLSDLLARIRANYDPNRSIEAAYSLTIFWNVREKEERRNGTIALAGGDRFRITAGDETLVSDGTTYWRYSSTTKQVVIRNATEVDRAHLPSQVFARYVVSCPFRLKTRHKGVAELFWATDSANAPYRSITVMVREKDGIIDRCVLVDGQGNRFTYSFTGTTIGKNFPGRTFAFSIPQHAQVVDARQ